MSLARRYPLLIDPQVSKLPDLVQTLVDLPARKSQYVQDDMTIRILWRVHGHREQFDSFPKYVSVVRRKREPG